MKTTDELSVLNNKLSFIKEIGFLKDTHVCQNQETKLFSLYKLVDGKMERHHHKDTYEFYDMNAFLRGYYYAKINVIQGH